MVEKKMEVKEEVKQDFIVGDVVTQTEPCIVNNATGENYNIYGAIATILNKITKIEKGITGSK